MVKVASRCAGMECRCPSLPCLSSSCPAACSRRALLAGAVEQGGGAARDAAALAPLVTSEAQAVALAAAMHRSRMSVAGAGVCVPMFATSAVTGDGLQLLHAFLNALQLGVSSNSDGPTAAAGAASAAAAAAPDSMQGWRQRGGSGGGAPTHFQIDGTFDVSGVGTGKRAPVPLCAACCCCCCCCRHCTWLACITAGRGSTNRLGPLIAAAHGRLQLPCSAPPPSVPPTLPACLPACLQCSAARS